MYLAICKGLEKEEIYFESASDLTAVMSFASVIASGLKTDKESDELEQYRLFFVDPESGFKVITDGGACIRIAEVINQRDELLVSMCEYLIGEVDDD
jgi:hypothetical protein